MTSTAPATKTPSTTKPTPSTPTPTTSLFTATTSPSNEAPTSSPAPNSTSTSNALARFEYESGRTRDCTKVLMVEWEQDTTTRAIPGTWAVTWEGKRTVLPSSGPSSRDDGSINRLYFLLPEGERVPGTVWLTLTPSDDKITTGVTWKVNPLPAIFPPSLGASASTSGKKGVLHTIWAKRRLQDLAREIDDESQTNVEGIALQMAIQERDWIETHFGVTTRPTQQNDHRASLATLDSGLRSPASPRSPGGGRLMDKLKGLKLNTSTTRSDDRGDEAHLQDDLNPLSPEQSDVAVSSFGSFAALKGVPDPSILGAKVPQPQGQRKFAPQRPPDEVVRQQKAVGQGSLNAITSGQTGFTGREEREEEREDDLFALPISPRSPDMGTSPFSFAARDTVRYVRGGKV
ncbi:hypothetical protein KVT40_002023 [Elsinoe batatas]|uniref:Uncharacterized protein n=1 Tax=Elsinoe batatas TaxID=2601811 RepID=A0A8K0PLW4_9PEZI|nr:hypothetical protein KVT40_002023 [Elsinoe batatas]